MSGIGRGTQLLIRAIVVAICAPIVAAYLHFFFPWRADCRAGNVDACAVVAIVQNPGGLLPVARWPVNVDWADGRRYAIDERTWKSLFRQGFPVLVRHVVIAGGILLSAIAIAYWLPAVYMRYSARKKHHRRGAQVVSERTLRAICRRRKPGGLTLGGIPIPRDLEPLSFRLAGSPGSGKSQAITRLIGEFRGRGDAAIIADAGGEFLARHWRNGDTILNPFDRRSASWSPFAELTHPGDLQRLCLAFVPEGEGEAEQWNGYARTLLRATFEGLIARGQTSNGWLAYICCAAPADEWRALVDGTPAARLFASGNDRMLASVAAILASQISSIAELDPDSGEAGFSVTRWVHERADAGHVLWLPYREDSRRAVAPLLAAWLEIGTTAAMTRAPSRDRRLFLVVDELAALGKISSLPNALAQGRKFGVSAIAGYQAVSQLQATYGRETSRTLLACLQNRLVLSTADYESADALSRELGEAEVAQEEHSMSGRIGDAASHTRREHRAVEKTILASEIQGLPPLEGFLRLAGDYPIARVRVPLFHAEPQVSPFELAPPRTKTIVRPDLGAGGGDLV